MKTFTTTPEEFASGRAHTKAWHLFRNRNRAPRKPTVHPVPRPKPGAQQPMQMGTVTPEDFGAGRPFWCHRAYGHRTGPVNTLKPVKENAAHFIVNNSELGPSRSNPSQIWAVSYVRLQRLLNADAPAGQLLPALYAWAGERSIPRAEVDAIIKLSPRAALAELTRMVNTSFSRADKRKGPPLPPGWNRTLWKVLHRLAQRHLAVTKREVKTQGAHVRKFGVRAEAKVLVNRLIGRTP